MFQTTRLSKVLAAILAVAFTVELFVPDTSDYLALVPGRTLPCVWNLVTCGLLTVNPVELAISIVGLLALARVVEPVYGSKEFLKFIFIVDLLIASVVFAFVYVAYAITTSGTLLYHQFSGFHGVIAALLVAVKQIMPLHELKLFGSFKLKVKYLPSVILLIVIGASVGLKRVDYLAFYIGGTYLGWIYLRFFQQQPDSNVYGDASEDFKFSSFFPEFLAPPIDMIAGVLAFITRLRHSPGDGQPVVKSLHSGGGPSVLGADVADANRRRERGAKALEERLGLKTAGANPTAGSGGDVEAGGGAATTSNQ